MLPSEDLVQVKFEDLENIRSSVDVLKSEREARPKKEALSFGVPFLDEAVGGIYENDLVLLGARTGAGKTQLATIVALANAQKHRVCYFALEAEPMEIERRIKFRMTSQLFHNTMKSKYPHVHMNYGDWRYGKFNELMDPYDDELSAIAGEACKNLSTFYRTGGGSFTSERLQKMVLARQKDFDLFIIDHLHFFDIEDENENRGMKSLLMDLRDLALMTGKPILLIAHIRKVDRRQRGLVPDIEDFHGSSDVVKIATKVVTMAPAEGLEVPNATDPVWYTYMRASKNRVDGSRVRYLGLTAYNPRQEGYDSKYYLAKHAFDKFDGISDPESRPYWAKSCRLWGRAF